MTYHVIIALNSVERIEVGPVICVLEDYGLGLTEFRKKTTHPRVVEFPDKNQLILEHKLNELAAMDWYRQKFTPDVLAERIRHFFRNHVELFFDGEGKNINPNEIWERIAEEVFGGGDELPIMFVVTSGGENGVNVSFIPDDLELDGHDYFNPRIAIPITD